MTAPQLGRLSRHDLRNVWVNEAGNFTPWLAQAENIALLSDTLGLELELEAREKAVGPFKADILCRDVGTDHWVLIENQLERTDHCHLGQLLTYASGLDAATVIWIAARFTEEHRSTLDWLNRITDTHFRFFGLEVELWQINDSLIAPKFNIVSKPNDWSHSVVRAAQAIDDGQLSETRLAQREYWAALNTVLESHGGPVAGNRKPQPQAWMSFPVGRSRFHLNAVMIRLKRQIRAELHIGGESATMLFGLLQAQTADIEKELGYPLQWEELPSQQDCRISIYLNDVDPEDQDDWPRQHDWLAKRLNELHRATAQRVRDLDIEGS